MNEDSTNLSSQKNAQAEPSAPELGGVRAGPVVAGVLYFLLVVSAALSLWVQTKPGSFPPTLATLAPWAFLLFVVAFALYRLALVRAGRYPAFKAFFQIGTAALFFMLLLPHGKAPYVEKDELAALMQDSNPRVRALAAEVARYRANAGSYGAALARALEDPEDRVRAEAHASLVKIAGEDLGPPSDPNAVKAWRARYP